MANATLIGGDDYLSPTKIVVDVGAFGKKKSDFGPDAWVLDEGTPSKNIEFRAEAVALGFDVKTFHPHGVHEVDEIILEGHARVFRGFS